MKEIHPVRRLLALAWRYRAGCVRVFGFQVVLLVLGVAGLRLSGVGIDLLRRALDPGAAAVHWPFGITPPPQASARALLLAVGGAVLAMAAARAALMYGYS